MKKFLCLMLSALLVLPTFSAFAATSEFGAYDSVYASNIFIRGKLADSDVGKVQQVSILFIHKTTEELGYIDELDVDKYGFYKTKFKFIANDGIYSDYKISIRDSETSRDITDTLQEVTAQKDAMTIDIDLNVAGDNDIIKYVSEGQLIDMVATVNNEYGDASNAKAMLAVYDANNNLLAVDTQNFKIGFADLKAKKTVNFEKLAFPAEAVKAKAFIWQDTVNLTPLAKDKTMEAYGEKGERAFINRNEDKSDPWVIGLAGASTVHAGQYAAFLYHYYATRHPEENIVIINKGAAGCTALDIFNRKAWDIFNENDPLGYGACDEIAIMVGANDVNYSGYANGRMDDDDYEAFYNGINVYTNHPQAEKNGKKVTNMTEEVNDSFNNYVKIVDWAEENNKKIVFTPMTVYDDSEDFEHILYEVGNVHGANRAFGMLSDKLEDLALERGLTFIDSWGASDEYTDAIRANTDPNIVNYIDSKNGYVFLGKDGLHHSSEGGYAIGYITARGQETDEIVAAVDIDALTGTSTTEDATVSDLVASSTGVSYTYLPKAIPLYAKSKGYVHTEKLGIDITNTMNKEIIKVTGLDAGTYTITMDDVAVTTATAEQLAAGVNIATLDKNPGQIQSKNAFETYSELRKTNENFLRNIFNEELRLRNQNTKEKLWDSNKSVQITNAMRMDHNDPRYDDFTTEDWIALCQYFIDNGTPTASASEYAERKRNQQTYVDIVKNCITGLNEGCKPTSHTVVITKN